MLWWFHYKVEYGLSVSNKSKIRAVIDGHNIELVAMWDFMVSKTLYMYVHIGCYITPQKST